MNLPPGPPRDPKVWRAEFFRKRRDVPAERIHEVGSMIRSVPQGPIHRRESTEQIVPIQNRDFWVKVVEMLQHNWALIEPQGDKVTVYFLHDLGGVFDEISFGSLREAQTALCINGFRRYDVDPSFAKICAPPKPPFRRVKHPNGPIYSSGRFWVNP